MDKWLKKVKNDIHKIYGLIPMREFTIRDYTD